MKNKGGKNKAKETKFQDQPIKISNSNGVYDKILFALNAVYKYFNTAQKFWIVTIFLFILGIIMNVSTQTFNGDDNIERNYGIVTMKYFKSLGKDASYKNFKSFDEVDSFRYHRNCKYYGAGLENMVAFLDAATHPKYMYFNRHFVSAIFMNLLIIVIGIFISKIKDYTSGIIAMLFFINTPQMIYMGYIYAGLKDVPFAFGFFIFIIATLNLIKNYPKLVKKDLFFLLLGFFITTWTRIISIMLLFYLLVIVIISLFYAKKIFKKLKLELKLILYASKILILLGVTYFISLATGYITFWTEGPINLVVKGVEVLKNFPQKIPVLFNGEEYLSTELPKDYILTNLVFNIPVFVLIGFFISIFLYLFYRKTKQIQFKYLQLVFLFCAVFPVFLIFYNNSAVYDRWRHITFIYPFIVIVSIFGIFEIKNLSNKFLKIFLYLIIILGFFKTSIWNIKNYPSQTAYWNELGGGTNNIWLKQELDPQQISIKPCLDWLLESNDFKQLALKRDSLNPIIIVSNSKSIFQKDLNLPSELNKKIKIINTGFKFGFSSMNWDFGIFCTLFIHPNFLNIAFPAQKGTIYEKKVDDVTLSFVVKRENTFDIDGIQAMQQNNMPVAIENITKAFNYDPSNFRIWNYYAYTLLLKGNKSDAKIYASKYLELFPDDQISNQIMNAN